jgi:Flp pilus assembly protein TadB
MSAWPLGPGPSGEWVAARDVGLLLLLLRPRARPQLEDPTMDSAASRTNTASTPSGRLLPTVIRLMVLTAAGLASLAVLLISFFVVLPLVLAGGVASYFYLRRRLRQAQHRSRDGVIDAEYTVIDRR